ncbi:hypothetical protein [Staphylococcus hyicus]|uniref:hypothetical protein n=1 Tax=Staphylococcus hyicus TaxID=1284 RepID=UPI0031331240
MNNIIVKNLSYDPTDKSMEPSAHKIKKDFENRFDKLHEDNKNIVIDNDSYKLDQMKLLIHKLQPYKVTHLKIEGEIYYKTIFQCRDIAILVSGCLTSGYKGAGSNEFAMVLKEIGFDDATLDSYIFSRNLSTSLLEFTLINNL